MPRSPHSVGVSATLLLGRCCCIAWIMALAFPGNAAIGTTGVPQSLPVEQLAELFLPTGKVPSPMSRPLEAGSFPKAVMPAGGVAQLMLLAGGGEPGVMLPPRPCVMDTAT